MLINTFLSKYFFQANSLSSCLVKYKISFFVNITELQICRLGLKEQEGVLHFQNFLHVHMLERAASAASELELWEESKIYTKQVLQHYQ